MYVYIWVPDCRQLWISVYKNSFHALITAWLNSFQRNRGDVQPVKCKAFWAAVVAVYKNLHLLKLIL